MSKQRFITGVTAVLIAAVSMTACGNKNQTSDSDVLSGVVHESVTTVQSATEPETEVTEETTEESVTETTTEAEESENDDASITFEELVSNTGQMEDGKGYYVTLSFETIINGENLTYDNADWESNETLKQYRDDFKINLCTKNLRWRILPDYRIHRYPAAKNVDTSTAYFMENDADGNITNAAYCDTDMWVKIGEYNGPDKVTPYSDIINGLFKQFGDMIKENGYLDYNEEYSNGDIIIELNEGSQFPLSETLKQFMIEFMGVNEYALDLTNSNMTFTANDNCEIQMNIYQNKIEDMKITNATFTIDNIHSSEFDDTFSLTIETPHDGIICEVWGENIDQFLKPEIIYQ